MTDVGRFEWTAERIATVRKIAEDGGTAREAAAAVGLEPERDYLLYKLANREGFRFQNVGRKRADTSLAIRITDETAQRLADSARKHRRGRREHAARLLAIVLMQGPTFIDNLLDEA